MKCSNNEDEDEDEDNTSNIKPQEVKKISDVIENKKNILKIKLSSKK